jgi:DNA-binding transcriptional LysR family regulator
MTAALTDWELMRVFLEVARSGSFVAAAEKLSSSQPTIGRKIDQLEAALEDQLLVRSNSGVQLTEPGRRVLQVAEKMELLTRSIGSDNARDRQLTGTIRAQGTDGMGGYWIPFMLSEFLEAHPRITFEANVNWTFGQPPNLSRREADIAVTYREPTDPDVCIITSGEHVFVPCAARAYAEKYGLPSTFEELLDHPLVIHEQYLVPIGPWARFAEGVRNHRRILLKSNSSVTHSRALLLGLGISFMPLGFRDREPDLVTFDLEGWSAHHPYWLIAHKQVKDLPAIRALINHFKATVFSGQPGSATRS